MCIRVFGSLVLFSTLRLVENVGVRKFVIFPTLIGAVSGVMKDLKRETLEEMKSDEGNGISQCLHRDCPNAVASNTVIVDTFRTCEQKVHLSDDVMGPISTSSRWNFSDNRWQLNCDDGEGISLLYAKHEELPLQCFHDEVRPTVDVEHFLSQGRVFLLDENDVEEPCSSTADLVDMVLNKLQLSAPIVEEARKILLTSDSITSRKIQAVHSPRDKTNSTFTYEESWMCAVGDIPSLMQRHMTVVRLKHPTNMGENCSSLQLFILILCPAKEKGTKNALEVGCTFSTLFADNILRSQLLDIATEEDFKQLIFDRTQELIKIKQRNCSVRSIKLENIGEAPKNTTTRTSTRKLCQFGQGIREDLARRLPHYLSDYVDGVVGVKTPQKVLSTMFFIYFACLLPAIAFGVLNDHNTHGKIGVKKVIMGQTIGGLFFVIFGGQPLLILLTTAPLALYIKVVSSISDDFQLDFYAMYGCVGLWCAIFLLLFSFFNVSHLMRWSTRSTEEIFGLFISVAFCVDAFRNAAKNFQKNFNSPQCFEHDNISKVIQSSLTYYTENETSTADVSIQVIEGASECNQASSLLFLLLMLGTVWLGVSIFNFKKSLFLSAAKREMLSDYALPIAVIMMSFVGSYFFKNVKVEPFRYDANEKVFTLIRLDRLPGLAILGAMGLGFALSLLILMDQNISSAMVNTPLNNLKKGTAYHWDLFVMAILTAALSAVGLPWMHALVPHSPLHARALADVEENVHQGHSRQIIVRVRETRLTVLFSHLLIGISMLLLPYPLAYIPPAVLNGLFLYVAITGLGGNQMFERIKLLFTEQSSYPPNHYIRRVPQRKIHQFTGCQLVQLLLMCLFGFVPWPYMKMIFPVILMSLLPIRHLIIPRIISDRYLKALDSNEH